MMKTFKDLVFNQHPNLGHEGGIQARMDFDNGYGVSVVKSSFTYGGDKGLYELAVFKDGHIHYDNPIAMGDVRGYLDKEEVSELMIKVQLIINQN